jgi:diguanylate cyclase
MGPFGNSHISEDLTQPERANEVAYEASAHIRKWRLPATPKCFELFFNYISGESPSLKIALDEMIQRGVLSANDVIALYRRFISAPDIDDRIKSIGVGLDDEIGKVADAIDDVAQFTRTSSAQVIDIRESLPKFKNADELKAFASELAQGVFEMRLVNSELEAKLRASRQEIDNLKKNLSLVQLEAQTDALTGLVNRKFLNVLLGKAFASFEATGNPLTLMMCDIDHFKAFNDKWGHLVGDQVLRLVGKTLLDCV